eukprot:SAG11_NODE_2068_length_3864_cov_6.492430_3_plen_47_part_00
MGDGCAGDQLLHVVVGEGAHVLRLQLKAPFPPELMRLVKKLDHITL